MASRSWFFASGGKQEGPVAEVQLREMISRGTVTAETYVWSEGMSDWQLARDVPGLMPPPAAMPPRQPGPPAQVMVPAAGDNSMGGERIFADFSIWGLLGRLILLVIGYLVIIPAPWTSTAFYRWSVEHLHVPRRPNLGFTGQPTDIWYVFILSAICGYLSSSGELGYLGLLLVVVQGYLAWMVTRWVVANISSNGQRLPLAFTGEVLPYIGWFVLLNISFITIVGWAWVTSFMTRWMCRHIEGSYREIHFTGTGLQILWRTLVFAIGCAFIIPIPWVLAWYARWYASQFVLTPRTA